MAEKRGRKSTADLSVVSVLPDRPKPPSELADEEAEVWGQIVGSRPGDWLGRDAAPLLVQYCRHIVRARRAAQLIGQLETSDDADEFSVATWKDLLVIQERETRAMLACARSLRITHQAQYRADSVAANKSTKAKRPWEYDGS